MKRNWGEQFRSMKRNMEMLSKYRPNYRNIDRNKTLTNFDQTETKQNKTWAKQFRFTKRNDIENIQLWCKTKTTIFGRKKYRYSISRNFFAFGLD